MRTAFRARAAIVRTCVLIGTACVLISNASAQSGVVLDGVPSVRVDSDGAQAKLTTLKEAERAKARVLIVRSEGKYWWATRENRELIHRESGVHHYFIDPRGGGYVKVYDPFALPESLRGPGDKVLFYEHVSLGLMTITYWGEGAEFKLGED